MVKGTTFDQSSYKRKASSFFSTKKSEGRNNIVLSIASQLPDVIDIHACWKAYLLDTENCSEVHTPPNPRLQNCKQNPYCIYRLGLEKFEKLLKQRDQAAQEVLVIRPKNQPCGLINTGNFCYVNSFLQLWFNDLVFRKCVYDWRPSSEFHEPTEPLKLNIQAVMNCLQRLFLTMQHTPFEYASASDFVKLLFLDNQQQDGQEFHTLFFDCLDRKLEAHPNGLDSLVSQKLKCENCRASRSMDSYYRSLQLSIKGCTKLSEVLKDFLTPELVEDYKCDTCGERGNVWKSIGFETLPEVLLIQLNRYIIDSKGRQKKLKNIIQYTHVLPQQALQPDAPLGPNGARGDYELTAVMVHEGQNAHCGHFYDLIKDPHSDQWFCYNDKEVTKNKPPGVEIEKQNIVRAGADMHGCYALIYQRKNALRIAPDELCLPPDADAVISDLLQQFKTEERDGNFHTNQWNQVIKERNELFSGLWADMEVKNGAELVQKPDTLAFLPTEVLVDALKKNYESISEQRLDSTEYVFEPVGDQQIMLCRHGKVPLKEISAGKLKAVHRAGAERFLLENSVRLIDSQKERSKDKEPNADPVEVDVAQNTDNLKLLNDKRMDVDSVNQSLIHESDYGRLYTGNDLCCQCVEMLKDDADNEKLFKTALEFQRHYTSGPTMRSNVYNPAEKCFIQPTDQAVWISLAHLKSFKRFAKMDFFGPEKLKAQKDSSIPVDEILVPDVIDEDKVTLRKRPRKIEVIKEEEEEIDDEFLAQCSDAEMDSEKRHSQQRDSPPALLEVTHEGKVAKMTNNCISHERDCASATPQTETIDEEPTGTSAEGFSVVFNSDIRCPHDKLAPDVKRIWITNEHWQSIAAVLSTCQAPFLFDSEECVDCIDDKIIKDNDRESVRQQIMELKTIIDPLLKQIEKRRDPTKWNEDEMGTIYTHFLCAHYTDKIKKASNKSKNFRGKVDLPRICQDCLLCAEHGLPYIPVIQLDKKADIVRTPAFPLTRDEWNNLVSAHSRLDLMYQSPREVLIGLGVRNYRDMCVPCLSIHDENERKKEFIYPNGAFIYLRKQKADGASEATPKPPFSLVSVQELPTCSRYRTRKAVEKDVIKIRMCSFERILDLKLRLYEKMNCSPNDQLIVHPDGTELCNPEQTLEEARVPPNNDDCPLTLFVQEHDPNADTSDLEQSPDQKKDRQPERGFRDTALYG